jgi:deoxyadenosine/deoxycytidine kinase
MLSKKFIVVAGNIGSGKTTLTSLLAKHYHWEPHFEVVQENPYLPDFYANMKRWSLPLQIFFLSKRFQAHQAILRSTGSSIQDRSIYEDAHIFARALKDAGRMDTRDYENYFELYKTMIELLTPPDLVVYVRRSVNCLKSRIRERGRDYEQDIPEAYLEQLNGCYDDWIGGYRLGKVLTVEADALDLKYSVDDFNYVCRSIEGALEDRGKLSATSIQRSALKEGAPFGMTAPSQNDLIDPRSSKADR